jgi:hypothetical protein
MVHERPPNRRVGELSRLQQTTSMDLKHLSVFHWVAELVVCALKEMGGGSLRMTRSSLHNVAVFRVVFRFRKWSPDASFSRLLHTVRRSDIPSFTHHLIGFLRGRASLCFICSLEEP